MHPIHDLSASEDDARLPHQEVEKFKFRISQLNEFIVNMNLPSSGIDLEPLDGKGRLNIDRRRANAANDALHTSEKNTWTERLRNIIISSKEQGNEDISSFCAIN
jgi:hypothetical protein